MFAKQWDNEVSFVLYTCVCIYFLLLLFVYCGRVKSRIDLVSCSALALMVNDWCALWCTLGQHQHGVFSSVLSIALHVRHSHHEPQCHVRRLDSYCQGHSVCVWGVGGGGCHLGSPSSVHLVAKAPLGLFKPLWRLFWVTWRSRSFMKRPCVVSLRLCYALLDHLKTFKLLMESLRLLDRFRCLMWPSWLTGR